MKRTVTSIALGLALVGTGAGVGAGSLVRGTVTANPLAVSSSLSADHVDVGGRVTATATVHTIPALAERYRAQATVTVPANASTPVLTIPQLTGLSPTYFIRLQLKDSVGTTVSDNTYWYSTKPDVLAGHSTWYKTTVKSYADLTGLNSLATNPNVTAAVARTVAGAEQTVTITLRNTSATNIAFFLRPEVTAGNGGNEVLPVSYTSNYVTLWPGDSTTITARYQTSDLGGQAAYLRVRGYNVPTTSVPVP